MSLKAFHLVFITASSALAFGCGVWWLTDFFRDRIGIGGLVGGILSIAAGLALIWYERYFLKKLKKVSFL